MLYNKEKYNLLAQAFEDSSISTIWSAIVSENFEDIELSYEERIDIFLKLIKCLLSEGRVKLGKHDKFLDGTIEEQIERYRKALPTCEEDLYSGLWFTFEECPGGIVWIHGDGYEYWT